MARLKDDKHFTILNEYNIREARKSDADEITFFHLMSWKTSYQGIIVQAYLDDLTLNNRLDLRKRILTENSGIHLVATSNDKIIADFALSLPCQRRDLRCCEKKKDLIYG